MSPAKRASKRTVKKAQREHASKCRRVLIAHRDGTFECVDDTDCGADEDDHELVEACETLTPMCRCGE